MSSHVTVLRKVGFRKWTATMVENDGYYRFHARSLRELKQLISIVNNEWTIK